jgi:hypothetical protein
MRWAGAKNFGGMIGWGQWCGCVGRSYGARLRGPWNEPAHRTFYRPVRKPETKGYLMSATMLAENVRVDAIAVMAHLDHAGRMKDRYQRHMAGIALGEARTLLRNANRLVQELELVTGTDRQHEDEG